MSDERPKKIFLMKIWIGVIAGFLLVLWSANLRNVWSFNQQIMSVGGKLQWAELKNSWTETVEEMSSGLDKVKEFKEIELEDQQIIPPAWLTEVIKKAEKIASSSEVVNLINSSTDPIPVAIESSTAEVVKD